MKIHRIKKIESLNGGAWWSWECDVEMSDGSIRHGTVEGDEHKFAKETLALE